MNFNNCNLYQYISERIEREEDEYINQLISGVFVESGSQHNEVWMNHQFMMLALRGYRICLACDMLTSQDLKVERVIISDFKSLVQSVEILEYKGTIDDSVVSDAIDCICAIHGHESMSFIIREYLPEEYQSFYKNNTLVSEKLVFLILNLAEIFFNGIDATVAVNMLQYLICISRKRNGADSIEHREIALKVTAELVESYPEEAYKICSVERNTKDEYTADFLWFSGCILQKKGENESAYKFFFDCYKLRQTLYGADNWYTALAKREYIVMKLFLDDTNKTNEVKYLEYFIRTIEENRYQQINYDMVKVIEGKTLYALILYKMKIGDFYSCYHFIELYGQICEKYNELVSEPLVKIRLYKNFLGIYYRKIGDYIQAEKAFCDAVKAFLPDGTVEIISIEQIKINLLMIYHEENDMEQAYPILIELLEYIDSEKSGLSIQAEYTVWTLYNSIFIQSFIELDEDVIDDLKSELSELYDGIMYDNLLDCEYAIELITYILTSVQLLIQNACITYDEGMKYYVILQKVESRAKEIGLNKVQLVLMYLNITTLVWELNEQEAEASIITCIKLLDDAIIPLTTKAAVFQTAAAILCKRGKQSLALVYLKASFEQIVEIWHSYMRYCNDIRLLKILSPTQLIFSSCYAVMREFESTSVLYEKVLQYKAIASLAGKERNRLLNSSQMDIALVKEIKKAQNKMAVLESESIFLRTSNEYIEEKEKLRNLEVEFAREFPIESTFIDITVNNVMREIPAHTVVIEYYLSTNKYCVHQDENVDNAMIFDVFVLRKEEEECSLERVVISDAEVIQEEVQTLVQILLAESTQEATVSQIEMKESLCLTLYKKLIAPIRPFINDISCIFIAPDSNIMNLPFDILCEENGNLFGDDFNIVKMECARDFLFGTNFSGNNKGSLIIGNPQYEVKDSFSKTEKCDCTRYVELRLENICQLPFSEVEVQLVGKYCNAKYLTGKKANKHLLMNGGTQRNIHLATHGYYDISEDTDTMYSSCLLFAGVKNWLQSGIESREFGNGIVTADEISRLDLQGVELVVLSSCLSAMNENILVKGFQGLIGGFSAAGVKYVIANLWNADDFGTAILMDAFYYQYKIKNLAPPEALRKAKQYLRKVTIGELKTRKWFDCIICNETFNDGIKEKVRLYMKKDERFKPFKNEVYWAGFTCYQCNKS